MTLPELPMLINTNGNMTFFDYHSFLLFWNTTP